MNNPSPLHPMLIFALLFAPVALVSNGMLLTGLSLGFILHYISGFEIGDLVGNKEPSAFDLKIQKTYETMMVPVVWWSNLTGQLMSTVIPRKANWLLTELARNLPLVISFTLPVFIVTEALRLKILTGELLPNTMFMNGFDEAALHFAEIMLLLIPFSVLLKQYRKHHKIKSSPYSTVMAGGTTLIMLVNLRTFDIDIIEKGYTMVQFTLMATLMFMSMVFITTTIYTKFIKPEAKMPALNVGVKRSLFAIPFVWLVAGQSIGLLYMMQHSVTKISTVIDEVPFNDAAWLCTYKFNPMRMELIDDCWMKDYVPTRIHEKSEVGFGSTMYDLSHLEVAYIQASRGLYLGNLTFAVAGKNLREDQLSDYFTFFYDINRAMDERYRPESGKYIIDLETRDRDLALLKMAADGDYEGFWMEYDFLIDDIHPDRDEPNPKENASKWGLAKVTAKILYINNIKPLFDYPGKEKAKRDDNFLQVQQEFDGLKALKERIANKPLPIFIDPRDLF